MQETLLISKNFLEKVIKQVNNDTILFIKIIPNSQKNYIVEIFEYNNKHYLKIKIKEVAFKFKANKELLSYLSQIFNIPKNSISIEQGENLPLKTIKIKNVTINTLQEKILELIKEK